jgi:hypothetical protein
MRINELIFAIQDFFVASFKLLPKVGNMPNILFIVIGFILTFIWVRQMAKYNKEAEEKGTLK